MKFEDQLKHLRGQVRLDPRKKEEQKAHLLHFIETKETVRVHELDRQLRVQRSMSFIPLLQRLKTMPIYAIILVLAIAGGGVSAAAQTAVPGDILYPIKVNVNEGVRAAFTVGAEAKTEYEATRAVKRLEEAEELAAKGKLSTDATLKIEENFAEHADRVEARVKEFEAREDFKAAADVTSNFETSLKAHEEILNRLSLKDSDAADVAEAVRVKAISAGERRAAVEIQLYAPASLPSEAASVSAKPTAPADRDEALRPYAERRRAEALRLMRDALEFIKKNRERLNPDVVAKAETQLRVADGYVVEGTAKLNATTAADTTVQTNGTVMEAARLFQRAINVAHEALIILKAQADIEAETGVMLNVEFAPIETSVDVRGETETEVEMEAETHSESGSSESGTSGEIQPLPANEIKGKVNIKLNL